MNNDRRTFLDGSTAPRKPLTEAKMIKPFVAPKEKTKTTKSSKQEELHKAVGDQLNELQTRGRYLQVDPKASIADLRADRKGKEERKSKKVYGMHGKVLAPSAAAYYKQHPRQRGLLHDPSTAGDNKYEEVTTEAKDTALAKHNAAVLRAAGGAKAYQAQKMAKPPILDREISEFVQRLSAKQIILLKKLIAARIAAAAELLRGNQGGYQGGNQIGNDYPGQYGNQGGNQIGNY